jgi:hypothetical protein
VFLYTLSHSTSPFCVRYFQIGSHYFLGWLQTAVLLISASS